MSGHTPAYPASRQAIVMRIIQQFDPARIEIAFMALNFFNGDEAHETIFKQQVEFMNKVRIEFFKPLDFTDQRF